MKNALNVDDILNVIRPIERQHCDECTGTYLITQLVPCTIKYQDGSKSEVHICNGCYVKFLEKGMI